MPPLQHQIEQIGYRHYTKKFGGKLIKELPPNFFKPGDELIVQLIPQKEALDFKLYQHNLDAQKIICEHSNLVDEKNFWEFLQENCSSELIPPDEIKTEFYLVPMPMPNDRFKNPFYVITEICLIPERRFFHVQEEVIPIPENKYLDIALLFELWIRKKKEFCLQVWAICFLYESKEAHQMYEKCRKERLPSYEEVGPAKFIKKLEEEKILESVYTSPMLMAESELSLPLKKWKENKEQLVEKTLAELLQEISRKINEQVFKRKMLPE